MVNIPRIKSLPSFASRNYRMVTMPDPVHRSDTEQANPNSTHAQNKRKISNVHDCNPNASKPAATDHHHHPPVKIINTDKAARELVSSNRATDTDGGSPHNVLSCSRRFSLFKQQHDQVRVLFSCATLCRVQANINTCVHSFSFCIY